MAKENSGSISGGIGNQSAEAVAKRNAARKATSDKLDRLGFANQIAYKKLTQTMNDLEAARFMVLEGKSCSPELLDKCAEVSGAAMKVVLS